MKGRSHSVFIWMAAIAMVSFTISSDQQKVKEYLSVPGPLQFNGMAFQLNWSSHPNNNYYKQEYLPPNEKTETFTKMLMIEALVGNADIPTIVKQKMAELDSRKQTDAVTNYSVINNPSNGEYLLDFVISQESGKQTIVEWNAYRYVKLDPQDATKGLLLFAYCRRSYGAATTNFLKALKTDRTADVKKLATYKVPAVKIKAG